VVTTGAIRRAKLQSECHHQQTNTKRFTGRMPLQYQSIEGKITVTLMTFYNQCNVRPSVRPSNGRRVEVEL